MATTRVPLWVMSPLFICLMVALFSSAPVARAQSAAVGNSPSSSAASTPSDASSQLAALPQPLTRAAIRDMVSRMSDDDVRRFLLQRLDAQAETAETPSQPSEPNDPTQQDPITTVASAIDRDVVSTFQSIPYLSGALADAWNGFLRGYGTDNHGHGYILVRQKAGWLGALDFAWKSLAILLVALVSMIGVPRLLKRFVAARIPAAPASASADRLRLIERFGTEASGILVFAVASLMLALAVFGLPDWASAEAWSARNGIVFPSPAGRSAITHVGNGEYFTFTHLLAAIVAGLCARLFGHLVFSPADASLRLVNCDDAAAAFLTRQTVLIVILALPTAILLPILSVWGLSESWQAQGMVGAVGPKFGFWFTGALIIACIYTMLKPYRAWSQIMLGFDSPGPVVRSLARIWPLVASGLFLLLMFYLRFVIAVYGPRYVNDFAEYVTIALIFSLPVFDTGMRALIDHFTLIRADNLSARQVRANEVVRTGLLRLGRIFVLVGLVLVLAAAWEIPLFASATAQGWLGPQIVAIFLALLVAYAAWALLGIFARRQVELDEGAGMALSAGGDGASSDQAMSRLGTVMPIIQRAGQGLILVTTLFVIMTELKINATPLIAAASVVGLAVGFGAQTLVKDIVSGVFYLAEDTFRVGEYIDVGGTEGTVEKISFRSLSLRATLGAIHTIPYGNVAKLTNFSRDWTMMKLKFIVPFETDLVKVRKIFKKIGQDLEADPQMASDLLQPFKSQGIVDVNDVGLVIRGKFMTRPGRQWTIRKEIYERVQRAFEEAGIRFARREVHVRVPDLDGAAAHDKDLLAQTAAQSAAQVQLDISAETDRRKTR